MEEGKHIGLIYLGDGIWVHAKEPLTEDEAKALKEYVLFLRGSKNTKDQAVKQEGGEG